jgi:hypothetical protein
LPEIRGLKFCPKTFWPISSFIKSIPGQLVQDLDRFQAHDVVIAGKPSGVLVLKWFWRPNITRQLLDNYSTIARQLLDNCSTITRQLLDNYSTITRQLLDNYSTITRQQVLDNKYSTTSSPVFRLTVVLGLVVSVPTHCAHLCKKRRTRQMTKVRP